MFNLKFQFDTQFVVSTGNSTSIRKLTVPLEISIWHTQFAVFLQDFNFNCYIIFLIEI